MLPAAVLIATTAVASVVERATLFSPLFILALVLLLGGTFIGMISTGLGELNGYFLLQRCRVPSKVAVATSVFVVAATALTASIGHAVQFAQGDHSELGTFLSLLLFTVPGAIVGGQIGGSSLHTPAHNDGRHGNPLHHGRRPYAGRGDPERKMKRADVVSAIGAR